MQIAGESENSYCARTSHGCRRPVWLQDGEQGNRRNGSVLGQTEESIVRQADERDQNSGDANHGPQDFLGSGRVPGMGQKQQTQTNTNLPNPFLTQEQWV